MARPLIYIPGESGATEDLSETIAKAGLADIGDGLSVVSTGAGPDGKAGRFLSWIDHRNLPWGYSSEGQTWAPSLPSGDLEGGRYWVGFRNDAKPTEHDLRRPKAIRGNQVELQGQTWSIVTADTLPRFPVFQSDGTVTTQADPSFTWLLTDIERRFKNAVEIDEDDTTKVRVSFDLKEDFPLFCRVLGVNYRVTPELISAMRILSVEECTSVCAVLMGVKLGATNDQQN